MPNDPIIQHTFRYRLKRRSHVFYADGRSCNPFDVGRHSLGTKDRNEALRRLKELDRHLAVKFGKTDPSILNEQSPGHVPLGEGFEQYKASCRVRKGGISPKSIKRYQAIFDKFEAYLAKRSVTTWNGVTTAIVESYLTYLQSEMYEYATRYLELTTIKQIIKWMIKRGMLPERAKIDVSFPKPSGTTTYCWSPEEYSAIISWCQDTPKLRWLHGILVGLGTTGFRISELASLRWSDLDLDRNQIRLTDERRLAAKQGREGRRTKNGRDRTLPVHADLQKILQAMQRHQDGLVFHGPKGGVVKPDTVRNILTREVLRPLRERFPSEPDQIGFVDGRLHSFRHYFCSTAAASGAVSEQVVKAWLGHRDSNMVRRYFHLQDEASQQHMKSLRFDVGATDEGRS